MVDYISGWCYSTRRLDGMTIIVTGANTGIGKETALEFYKRGARVIMACRNMERAESAKKDIQECMKDIHGTGDLVVQQLDLCSLASVRAFVARILATERGVNVLVCNAGVMLCPKSKTVDGFETHIGSNHFAHALLTLLLLPLLVKSAPARIVFVSSRVHQLYTMKYDDLNFERTRYDPLRAYAHSKIANILFTKALDKKLKEHNINNVTTYSVHPGIVKTDIGRHLPETGWRIISYGFQNAFLQWCWKTPRCGAQTTIYCAIDEACENESGYYYSDCGKAWSTRQCRNEAEADEFWDITIKMLKLQDYDPFAPCNSK